MLNFIKAMAVASLIILVITLGAVMRINRPVADTTQDGLTYPETRRASTIDNYFGVDVPDPYRWLEDYDSGEVHSWVDAQNNLTEYYLDLVPEREAIRDRLGQLWDYEKYGLPIEKGGRYFYTLQDGLQDQPVLYWTESLNGRPIELLDPNKLSSDGTISLSTYQVSWDGRYLAYALSDGGADWRTWYVREVNTGEDLPDKLEWTKFTGVAWTPDNRGFFYGRYEQPLYGEEDSAIFNQRIFYHELGNDYYDDELIFESPQNPDWLISPIVTEDGSTLILHINQSTEEKNRIYLKDLKSPNSPVVPLLDDFDAQYIYLGNDGSRFWFKTNLNAPNGRVIEIDVEIPARSNWLEVVPERAEAIESASLVGDRIFVNYLQDARSAIEMYDLSGRALGRVDLPGLGTASGFSGEMNADETFYVYTDFTTPATIYRYDLSADESEVYRQPFVDFDPAQFEIKQVFYTSKDGTQVPMFIAHKRGIQLDGNNPTLLYGYGGFNIALTPVFSVSRTVWMEMGGVFALANLRGGGEYGQAWHEAGTKMQKQNVFDDFIAAGEWLIDNGYTNPDKLAIQGGSNGGLLTGAVLLQRPDLIGAVIVQNGVLDMLRYHKFTIGWAWASDYGTSEESASMFRELHRYSPVHNAYPGRSYPSTLITTADHDDRVVPAHSYKFAAALQRAQGSADPILIRIQKRAGHGAGKPTSIILDEVADLWAFLVRELEMDMDRF